MIVHDVTLTQSMLGATDHGWRISRNQYSYSLNGARQLTTYPLTQDLELANAAAVAEYIAVYRYVLGSDNQWHLLAYATNYGPYKYQAFRTMLPGETMTSQDVDPGIPFIPWPDS